MQFNPITVPLKNTGEELSASEFNQYTEALRFGTRSVSTLGLTVGGYEAKTHLEPQRVITTAVNTTQSVTFSDTYITSKINNSTLTLDLPDATTLDSDASWSIKIVNTVTNGGALTLNLPVGQTFENNGLQTITCNSNMTLTVTLRNIDTLPNGVVNLSVQGAIRYKYEQVLRAESFTTQQPTATNTLLDINYGVAQGAPTDPVQLLADGTMQFNQAGSYTIQFIYYFSREGSTGASVINFRGIDVVANNQITQTVTTVVDSSDVRQLMTLITTEEFPAGFQFKVQISRDSSGDNSGGLFPYVTADPNFADSPSAFVEVYRQVAVV